MTHIPAALQHCLAWQSALLFNWDGEQALSSTSSSADLLQSKPSHTAGIAVAVIVIVMSGSQTSQALGKLDARPFNALSMLSPAAQEMMMDSWQGKPCRQWAENLSGLQAIRIGDGSRTGATPDLSRHSRFSGHGRHRGMPVLASQKAAV